MSQLPPCPQCKSEYTYESGAFLTCPECGNEWSATEQKAEDDAEEASSLVKDSNGVILQDGDTVVVVKDLPVKGFLKSIKTGTKIKGIRLTTEGAIGHNISCKVDDFGAMILKSEFVRKA